MPVTLLDLAVVASWVLLPVGAYVGGRRRWRRRGARVPGLVATAAALVGLVIIGGTLTPTLGSVLEETFARHMLQHLALGVVGPLLLVVGRTFDVVPWALGPAERRAVRAALRRRWRRPRRIAMAPYLAAGALAATWAVWHLPVVHDAAVEHSAIHGVEHLSVVAAGISFWVAVAPHRRRSGISVLALFGATLAMGLVGAVLSLSPEPFYDAYAGTEAQRLADQQLGGLIMWTPGGLVFLLAAVVQLVRWLDVAGREDRQVPLVSRHEVGLS